MNATSVGCSRHGEEQTVLGCGCACSMNGRSGAPTSRLNGSASLAKSCCTRRGYAKKKNDATENPAKKNVKGYKIRFSLGQTGEKRLTTCHISSIRHENSARAVGLTRLCVVLVICSDATLFFCLTCRRWLSLDKCTELRAPTCAPVCDNLFLTKYISDPPGYSRQRMSVPPPKPGVARLANDDRMGILLVDELAASSSRGFPHEHIR